MKVLDNATIAAFLENTGKRGRDTLTALGKSQDFIDAINTEVGVELLKDLVLMYEENLMKVAELSATDEDKIKLKVTRALLAEWSSRILAYQARVRDIINAARRKE